jgi:elongation factor G
MQGPDRLLDVAIEADTAADRERLHAALEALAEGDPYFHVTIDRESGQTVMQGMSEAHLEEKLRLLDGISFRVGAPQVAYRETLTKPVTIDYTHRWQSGGSGEFARVKITYEPLPPGSGFVFENGVVGGSVPNEFVPAVEKGIKAQKDSGPLAGFPAIDFKARLVDGAYHEVDSNARTFDIAARASFREVARQGVIKLVEPVMKVEVVTPEDFLGGVIGDVNSRRGSVEGTDNHGDTQIVTAMVPLANMFGYGNSLQSMTRGRAHYSMHFDHYAPVPWPGSTDDDPTFPGAVGMRVA